MPTDNVISYDTITVEDVRRALQLVVFEAPSRVERPEPACEWSKLCGTFCRFPRYHRDGRPNGLVAHVLVQLGYPISLLKNMDMQYELGEVLHPGVKIARCRDKALRRIDPGGISLLAYVQDHQKSGMSWSQIDVEVSRPRRLLPLTDSRRRPWLY